MQVSAYQSQGQSLSAQALAPGEEARQRPRSTGAQRSGGRQASAPLGNTEIVVNPAKAQAVARLRAWRRQNAMAEITNLPALKGCHRWAAGEAILLSWSAGGISRFEGLQNSNSRWGSPLAEIEVMGDRRIELAIAAKNHLAAGGALVMMVGTVRHNRGQSFEAVKAGVRAAHSAVVKTSQWRKERSRYGISHTYSDYEVTRSAKNGWHLHKNTLLFLEHPLSDLELSAFGDSIFSRWSAGAVRAGLEAPLRERGVKLEQVSAWGADAAKMATYLAKGMAEELAGASTKESLTAGSMTPFQMLDVLAGQREAGKPMSPELVRAWREYEVGSKNLRSSWSRGTKRDLGIDFLSDEQRCEMEAELYELAGMEAPERPDSERFAIARVPRDEWRKIQSNFEVRAYVEEQVGREKTVERAQIIAKTLLGALGIEIDLCMISLADSDLDSELPSHEEIFKKDLNSAVFEGIEQTIMAV